MTDRWDAKDSVDAIALAWLRERPGTPVDAIGIVTRVWQCAKLLGADRRRVLGDADADAATLDLLSVLRRSGPPYRLTTRQLAERALITAGAISQRVARAELAGLVRRASEAEGSRAVTVTLTAAGHQLVERLVDRVLGREAELISGLTAGQQVELTELLRLLLDTLRAQIRDEPVGQVGAS